MISAPLAGALGSHPREGESDGDQVSGFLSDVVSDFARRTCPPSSLSGSPLPAASAAAEFSKLRTASVKLLFPLRPSHCSISPLPFSSPRLVLQRDVQRRNPLQRPSLSPLCLLDVEHYILLPLITVSFLCLCLCPACK